MSPQSWTDAARIAARRDRRARGARRPPVPAAHQPPGPGVSRIRRPPAAPACSTTPASCLRRRSPRTSRSARIHGPARSSAFAPRSPRRARRAVRSSPARRVTRWAARVSPGTARSRRSTSSWLEADTARKVYRVAAGTRWSTVIAKLDAIGFSPAVMQSNNDFGVASTFSVNAHGWPVPFSGGGTHGPVADHGPRGWHGRHLLAHGERRPVPSRHGRLRTVRRDHRAGARHGAERPARPALRRDERSRDRRAIRAAARVRPHHPDGLRADGRGARSLLRTGPA